MNFDRLSVSYRDNIGQDMSTGTTIVENVTRWLREGGDNEAADLINQCEIETYFVDLFFEVGGGREYELYDFVIAAPRKVHRAVQDDAATKEKIESAVKGCSESQDMYIRGLTWLPRVGTTSEAREREQGTILAKFDAEHVTRFWQKCLERKDRDPDGAITAARSMLESVCKHILATRKVPFDPLAPLPTLFHDALESVSLAPRQQTNNALRKLLGNCQAVVSGVGAIRNDIGDAHGKLSSDGIADTAQAELVTNLASAVAIFVLQKMPMATDPI